MCEKFRVDGHLYYSSGQHFFRDSTEITPNEFYGAFYRRLKQLD